MFDKITFILFLKFIRRIIRVNKPDTIQDLASNIKNLPPWVYQNTSDLIQYTNNKYNMNKG